MAPSAYDEELARVAAAGRVVDAPNVATAIAEPSIHRAIAAGPR